MRLLDPGWGEALRHQVGDPFLERDRVDTVEPLLAEPRKDSDPEQRLVASVGLRLEVRAGGQPALCPILEWRADKSGSIHTRVPTRSATATGRSYMPVIFATTSTYYAGLSAPRRRQLL